MPPDLLAVDEGESSQSHFRSTTARRDEKTAHRPIADRWPPFENGRKQLQHDGSGGWARAARLRALRVQACCQLFVRVRLDGQRRVHRKHLARSRNAAADDHPDALPCNACRAVPCCAMLCCMHRAAAAAARMRPCGSSSAAADGFLLRHSSRNECTAEHARSP